jgi:hypothetical protein
MELPDWVTRSSATAAMLNPAVVAVAIAAAADRYEDFSGEPMPWELIYLVVPMALHRDTREALPARVSSHPANWVTEHAVLQAGLPARASGLAPYVREGFRFGLRTGAIAIVQSGRLSGTLERKLEREAAGDLPLIVTASAFLGRWFAHIGTPATVFALFGVAP